MAKVFAKKFSSFEDGVKELSKVSFSAEQALAFKSRELPLTEEAAVTNLALNAAFDRPTGNGVGWAEVEIDISAYGVTYRTRGGLIFGWKAVIGASQRDIFEDEYLFFVAHPKADEDSAAPEESSLRASAEAHGWEEVSEFTLSLEAGIK